jgi:hypothetical protein
MKATLLIRKQGLCCRMEAPESFLARMNKYSMAMTQSVRKPDSKRRRKTILRQMKALSKTIVAHARRHREELDQRWKETVYSRGQAEQILRRIDSVLEQLPEAVRQAHERIIGERPVANCDKILSLYEQDIHIIVRGKAGAAVEFGNTLLVAENQDGLIVDQALLRDASPGDSKILSQSLERVRALDIGPIHSVGADRGFNSQANSAKLEQLDIFDATCPRDPQLIS